MIIIIFRYLTDSTTVRHMIFLLISFFSDFNWLNNLPLMTEWDSWMIIICAHFTLFFFSWCHFISLLLHPFESPTLYVPLSMNSVSHSCNFQYTWQAMISFLICYFIFFWHNKFSKTVCIHHYIVLYILVYEKLWRVLLSVLNHLYVQFS